MPKKLNLVSLVEIAELLNVKPTTVRTWRHRGDALRDPMPPEEWTVSGNVPVWREETILDWAEASGRLNGTARPGRKRKDA